MQGIYESAEDTRTGILKRLFAHLEQKPIIDIKKNAIALDSSYNTISTAVKKLLELGVLLQVDAVNENAALPMRSIWPYFVRIPDIFYFRAGGYSKHSSR